MNKGILLAASAVMALGFSSCEDEGEYSLELTSSNVTKLAAALNSVDLLPSAEYEDDEDEFEDDMAMGLASGLLFKESMAEDCEGGGSKTSNETEVGDTTNYAITFTQCTEGNITRTGSMNTVLSSDGLSVTGDFTVTGLSGITSIEYKDLVMSGSTIFNLSMTTDLVIVSDDFSGSLGYSIVSTESGQTLKLTGASDTEYTAVYTGEVGVCTLNEETVPCIE